MKNVLKLLATLLLLATIACILPSCQSPSYSSVPSPSFSSVPDHDCKQYSVWKIEKYPTHDKEGSKKLVCDYCGEKLSSSSVPLVSAGLSYEIANDGVWITGIGSCTGTELVIPEKIDGKEVVGIKGYAFKENRKIKSVVMPDSIKEIGDCAFLYISTLEDIILSEKLEKMGSSVFLETGLKSIYIPGSVKDSLIVGMFSRCKKLERAILGEGVELVGYATFLDCESLEFVSLPGTLKNIQNAFYGCENLAVVNFRGNIGQYCELERTRNTNGGTDSDPTFYNAKLLLDGKDFPKNIVIPEGTTKIAARAFKNMDITSIKIPNSVVSIGNEAFWFCTSLENVEFGNGLKNIGHYAFRGCESLTEIKIKDGIETIEHGAFQGCKSVEYFEIGEGLEVLKASTLEGLLSLKTIKFPSTLRRHVYPLFLFDTKLENVYYGGTVEQWLEFIESASSHTCDDFDKVKVHCSDGEVYDNKRVEK